MLTQIILVTTNSLSAVQVSKKHHLFDFLLLTLVKIIIFQNVIIIVLFNIISV